MIPFENITLSQIVCLLDILSRSRLSALEVIEGFYKTISINFPETVEFLTKLNLITVENKQIRLSKSIEDLFESTEWRMNKASAVRKFIGLKIISSSDQSTSPFVHFIKQFSFINGEYTFSPKQRERIFFLEFETY